MRVVEGAQGFPFPCVALLFSVSGLDLRIVGVVVEARAEQKSANSLIRASAPRCRNGARRPAGEAWLQPSRDLRADAGGDHGPALLTTTVFTIHRV